MLSLPLAWSVPANEFQTILDGLGDLPDVAAVLNDIVEETVHAAQALHRPGHIMQEGEEKVEQWLSNGKEFVKQDGLTCKQSLCYLHRDSLSVSR